MAITWILVANASLARLYANFGPKQGLKLVKELVHPESRMKNAELSSDRAGQMQASGSGHGAREQQTPPKLNAAKQLAFYGDGCAEAKLEIEALARAWARRGHHDWDLAEELADLMGKR